MAYDNINIGDLLRIKNFLGGALDHDSISPLGYGADGPDTVKSSFDQEKHFGPINHPLKINPHAPI